MAATITALPVGASPAALAQSEAPPSPTAASTRGVALTGRLMFSRFDEATHAFLSEHTILPDGSDETEIPLPGPEGGGRWSRSGTEIAVMTILPDDRVGTAIITPEGTVARMLDIPDDSLNAVCVVWSPDDSRLACEAWDDGDPSRRGIYTVRSSDGGDLKRLTTTPEGMADLPGDYSPEGTLFVFKRAVEEAPGSLMLVDVAGGEPRPLSTTPSEDGGRFSPDGAAVLTSAGGRITVLDLAGEVLQDFGDPDGFLFGPVWSPDGERIAFSRATGGFFADIFVSLPDGTDRQQVTMTPANEINIDWGHTED
jgi:Tol biopolymer transport system component